MHVLCPNVDSMDFMYFHIGTSRQEQKSGFDFVGHNKMGLKLPKRTRKLRPAVPYRVQYCSTPQYIGIPLGFSSLVYAWYIHNIGLGVWRWAGPLDWITGLDWAVKVLLMNPTTSDI